MRIGLGFGTLCIAGVGLFFYSTNTDIQSKINRWIGANQADSVHEISPGDTLSKKILHSNKVHPAKSETKKEKIPKVIKPDKFASLDKYARETPEKYAHSMASLAEYLEKPAKNDLEKARLIYAWIATHIRYDDIGFNSGSYKHQSADGVLATRMAVCDGFSSLYRELGLKMGLAVEKVLGYSKGYGSQPGDKFSSINHAWNAVKINNTWQLIDVTWGSQESEATDKGLRTTMKFDPYWFCASPEQFIFSHLPQNEDWQLTGSVITMKQYEELPSINDNFFKMGFEAKEVFKQVISGGTKELVETFGLDYPIRKLALPFSKKIVRGKEYNFSVESEYLEKVVIIEGEQWIELEKEGNVFKIRHTPKGDKLEIAVQINWFDEDFSTIVSYDIVDEKNLTACNKRYTSSPGLL